MRGCLICPTLTPRLETKNIWARDDPAIVLIICAMLCISAIAWGATYRLSISGIMRLALLMVFRDFLGSGLVLATTTWYVYHVLRFYISVWLTSVHDHTRLGSFLACFSCHRSQSLTRALGMQLNGRMRSISTPIPFSRCTSRYISCSSFFLP